MLILDYLFPLQDALASFLEYISATPILLEFCMTCSMTAFARVESQLGESVLCWEIKSVNHRYLDVSFRLPESFRFIEGDLRQVIRGKVFRGKLECQLKVNELMSDVQAIKMNEALVQSLIQVGETLKAKYALVNDLSVSHLLAYPGILQISQPDMNAFKQQVERSFQEALSQLLIVRRREGAGLKDIIGQRLLQLREEMARARQEVTLLSRDAKEKLLKRLALVRMEVVEARIEQEIALLLTRMDVSEELDRLDAHITEVAKALNSEGTEGRRLDFLMQELNREANTLSAKSDSVLLTQQAVQMKVLIEQMREQIQNIE